MTRPNAGLAGPETQIVQPSPRVEGGQFCRVTVLAPQTRMDLALPTDLTVAELVPMLTELAGEVPGQPNPHTGPLPVPHPDAPASWCLAAAAGAALPPGATLAGLGVLDGDLLRLRRNAEAPPPPVFDDPVDAVAEAVAPANGEPGAWGSAAGAEPEPFAVLPWTERCRRTAGIIAGLLAALGASVLLAGARGLTDPAANPVAAVIGGLAVVGMLAGAMRAAQGRNDTSAAGARGASVAGVRGAAGPVAGAGARGSAGGGSGAAAAGSGADEPDRVAGSVAVALAFAAVPLAAVTGLAALPGTPGAGHLLLASALAAAASATAVALLSTAAPALVATVLAAGLTSFAALLGVFDVASFGGLAAATSAVAVGLLPLLPRVSVRLAGLPPPVIPTSPEDMIAADQQWDFAAPEEIRYQAQLAHTYLAGLVIGASAVAGFGALLAAGTGGWAGPAFASVVVCALMLRSRCYATAAASAAPMAAGLLAGSGLAAGLAVRGPDLARLIGAPGLLVAGAVAFGLVWLAGRRESSPVARRTADVVEAILVVATFPLALAVLDLYSKLRGL
ncbi:hypothetical protein GCM10023321_07130 [Pseudonocardia eucalypti]|uniref:EccD-like transmembrane domain-containing protein n=1 Tax=Pseudonocardia eucalypti TaxID=648755 RepID=A0ABP9PI14_9PSEU|nr:hypothetical protein [Pseudonocardia eucalypti]